MNKSMKIIIVIGIVFILCGGIFFGAAYAFGERYIDSKTEDRSEIFKLSSIEKLDIRDSVANINFLKNNNGDEILVEAKNVISDELTCESSGNTLKISYNPRAVKFGFISFPSWIFNWNTKIPEINIYIPESKIFDDVYIGGGVGTTQIEILNTKYLTLSGGVGNVKAKNIVTENLRIDGRVGTTDIDAVINGETKIGGGVGTIKISGEADGDMTINGGVGTITLNLSGDMNEYSFNVNRGLGSIKFNGNEIGDNPSRTTGGKYNVKIDGGVGDMNITIK